MTPNKTDLLSRIDEYQQTLSFKFWSTDKTAMTVLGQADHWGWRDQPEHRVISLGHSTLKPMCKLTLWQLWKRQTMKDDMRRDYGPAVMQAMRVAA